MKFDELLSKRKSIIPIIIILIASIAVFASWKYKNYLNNRWSGIDFENEISEIEGLEEEHKVQEGGISIIEEKVEEEVSDPDFEIREVTQEEPPKPTLTKESTVIPAIKMEEPKMETMLTPVFGTICLDFSGEDLIYSKTLDLWTTHQGLDIKSEEGSQVRAAMDGTVSEAVEDPQWGILL